MAIEKLEFILTKEWEEASKESWRTFIKETATNSEGTIFVRNKGNNAIYMQVKDGFLKCVKCSSDIMTGTVAHPIRDGFFELSGSGEVHYEKVPYCPKCEKEPNFDGEAVPAKVKYY